MTNTVSATSFEALNLAAPLMQALLLRRTGSTGKLWGSARWADVRLREVASVTVRGAPVATGARFAVEAGDPHVRDT